MDLQLFAEERREQPTQKRRQDARKRGQVAKSQEISVLATLLFGALAIRVFGPTMIGRARQMATLIWSSLGNELTMSRLGNLMLSVTIDGFLMLAPVMGLVAVAAFVSEVSQVGWMMTEDSITFNLSRVDPFAGLKRVFSKRSIAELLKSIVKVSIVGLCLYQVVRSAFVKIPDLMGMSLVPALGWGASIVWQMIIRCAMGLVVLAGADYAFQWWENEQSLMMTRKELLDELKDSEGRPEVKAHIRARQRQIAMGRMMANVKKADVVIANPDHFAVALKYDTDSMAAPVVIAKGAGWLALKIKDEARQNSVTIVENPPVARALYASVEIGGAVPPTLYQAVAEILAFVYRLKAERQNAYVFGEGGGN